MTKDMQTEQLLCWSGMTETEQSTTSSSNEEEQSYKISYLTDYKIHLLLKNTVVKISVIFPKVLVRFSLNNSTLLIIWKRTTIQNFIKIHDMVHR